MFLGPLGKRPGILLLGSEMRALRIVRIYEEKQKTDAVLHPQVFVYIITI